MNRRPRWRTTRRYGQVVLGTITMGIGIAMVLTAAVGLLPLDILHSAVARLGGWSIGGAIIVVQSVLLALYVPLRLRPGPGTVAAAVVPAVACDVATGILPAAESLPTRLGMLLLGGVQFALGTAAYLSAGLGSLPRDGLMLALHQRRGHHPHLRRPVLSGTRCCGPRPNHRHEQRCVWRGQRTARAAARPEHRLPAARLPTDPGDGRDAVAYLTKGSNHMILRRGVLLGIVALFATGCTGSPTTATTAGTAVSAADQPTVNAAVPEAIRARVVSYTRFRAIDPCALHDPTAAAAITGDQVDELLPNLDGLNQCVLRLTRGEFAGTWTLYLEVGAEYDASRRRDAAPETVGGALTYRENTDDKTGCDLARPLDDTFAIVLRVRDYTSRSAQNRPSIAPCDLGRDYIDAAAAVWADPPWRDRGLTSPTLTLAELDPCEAASALLPDYGDNAELHPTGPFKCGARAGYGSSGKGGKTKEKKELAEITVSFAVEEQPLTLAGQKVNGIDHTGLTIGARKAVAAASRSGCRTAVVWDENTWLVADAKTENAPKTYEVIVIQSESCDTAQATAEKVLAKAGRR